MSGFNLTETVECVRDLGQPYYRIAEETFIEKTQGFHFGVFCIIYSIIFIFLFRKLTRRAAWRPKNRQLKTFRQKVKEWFFSNLFSLPILSTYINGKFQQSLDKEELKVIQSLQKHWDTRKLSALPSDGMTEDNLRKRIYEWKEKEKNIWDTGKVSGAFYTTEEEHAEKMTKFAGPFLYQNPLHLDTYKELMKIEKELLDMTNQLITDPDPNKRKEYFGAVTSGGSESLILALYAYRNYYGKQKPNIVIPVTAHAAIDKGCFYLNIEARKAKLADNYEVDLKHLESLIDKNTIMILGSAPNYPHGIIDPIEKMAKIAIKYKVGMHVDGCLGGFVGTFSKNHRHLYSLDQKGVTSVSLDHHKFALAPKGISTIFYKTKELRHAQYYINMDWIGGLYGTMTFPGSRPGFASAAAWYSFLQVTKTGFKENSKDIIEATTEGARKLRQVKGIKVFGNPQLCVIAFTSTEEVCSPLSLTDFLNSQRKWNISSIHKPYGIHISVTLANAENVKNNLARDVNDGMNYLREKNEIKQSMASQLYGSTTKIPTNGMQSEVLKLLMAASMK